VWYITNIDQKSEKGVFFMKKPLKILGIIAFIAVIVFSMTACPAEGASSSAKPENFITVTEIPPGYNGMIGALKLYSPDSSKVTVYSTEEKISGDSVTLPLFKWSNEDPWSGSGRYDISIFIFRDKKAAAAGNYIYKGATTETSITEATTAIEWALFTPKP
jgi:hypothetical protein